MINNIEEANNHAEQSLAQIHIKSMLDLPTKDDSVKYFLQLFKKYEISNIT
jgi:hypothetical protein